MRKTFSAAEFLGRSNVIVGEDLGWHVLRRNAREASRTLLAPRMRVFDLGTGMMGCLDEQGQRTVLSRGAVETFYMPEAEVRGGAAVVATGGAAPASPDGGTGAALPGAAGGPTQDGTPDDKPGDTGGQRGAAD